MRPVGPVEKFFLRSLVGNRSGSGRLKVAGNYTRSTRIKESRITVWREVVVMKGITATSASRRRGSSRAGKGV